MKAQMDWLKKHKFVMVAIFILILMFLSLAKRGRWGENLMPEACEMPCWRGIEVGKTTEEQFLQMTKVHPEQFSDLFRSESSDSSVYYTWDDNEAKQTASGFITSQIIEIVRLRPANRISLDDVLAVFGPPDTYIASLVGGGGAGSLNVNLFYEDLGIMMDQFFLPYVPTETELTTCSISISEEFPIDFVYFTRPDSAKQMAEAVGFPLFDEPREWTGTGDVALTTCDYVEKR